MPRHAPKGPIKGPTDLLIVDNPNVVQHLNGHPQRCSATSKRTGVRCNRAARLGMNVCQYHGGNAPQVLNKAKERLMALQPKAIQTMDKLLGRDEFPTVQLGAAKDVLDRTEGKAAQPMTGPEGGSLAVDIIVKVIRGVTADDI